MTRRLVLLLILTAGLAVGAATVLWWPDWPVRAIGLWPYSAEGRAGRAAAAIDAQDAATLSALVRGADHANLATADGETLLLHAVRARNVPAVGLLLARGADPERTGRDQRSPLALAAELHLHEVIGMLAAKGARVHEVPGRPLLTTLPSLTAEELRALLAAGANPYAASEKGGSIFRAAAVSESPEALRIILGSPLPPDPDARREALGVAVASGKIENVKLLLAAGADLASDPLAWRAASAGHADMLRLLLDAGADPDAHPAAEPPPIVAAAQRGHLKAAQELAARPGKRAGLDLALLAAVRAGHPEVAAAVRAAGAALPEDAATRQDVEHALSRAALGPNPPPAARHKPVAAAWDGPLLVGTTLLERCPAPGGDAARPAKWGDVDLPVSSLGRAEGDEVQALLAGGKAVRARFGKVRCLPGGCDQGWYEAGLQGAAARETLAIAPPGFVPARGKVSVLRQGAGRCAPPAPGAPAEGKWTRGCALYRGPGKLAVEVLEYAAPAGGAVLHARLLGSKPGPWLDLGDKAGLAPRLAIEAPGKPARFLLSRPSGAAGNGLVCVARERPGSGLELGRCFAAGGRTCQ